MAKKTGAEALDEYVATAKTAILQCRTGRHTFPFLDTMHITRPKELAGNYLAEGYCENECGTHVERQYSPRGYLIGGTRSGYVYHDSDYLLPKDVTQDPDITQTDVNAACRLELMKRGGAL